ncbi:MAG TPA: bifunctional phosphoribosylaminoimidazolecarboxamide formyltransferase/IMP cyclohydrolase [Planctomycetota bacterium]|nr:bifunctional phosphoribosylaminoimidazolecarboxamide formyltransferase/IMP cyclohydrolase [Planctomycetota bacterium]
MSSKITRALISVSDKTGIADFAAGLAALGVELVSTGGTAKALREKGLKVKDISEITGFPEIMDGRVKTLHPKVHGGLLFRRDLESHVGQAREHGIEPIDLVVVNLYPFEQTIAKEGISTEEAIEQIDIGGPSMIRSAAKNWESVTVVVDPDDYATVLREMQENGGATNKSTRLRLSAKVFATTSRYDGAICSYMESIGEEETPPTFTLHGSLKQSLRYGENPHQKQAALYVLPGYNEPCVAQGAQISGKEIGFNNLLDMNTAFEIVKEFERPAACIVKHNNPCGAASGDDILEAYKKAYEGDPLSAFGGVLGLNRRLDHRIAEEILGAKGFKVDAIVVPTITAEAKELLTTKKKWGSNVIIVEAGDLEGFKRNIAIEQRATEYRDVRTIPGGILVQSQDATTLEDEFKNLKCVTKREPTPDELAALKFAWIVCKHVKSNAIVLGKGTAIVGVGAGQMSRVDSVEIAIKKAGERSKGAVLASDAFFPFPDGPEAAAKAGVTAMIQPGGSVKDAEVFALADKYNVAMMTTGYRHFRH